MNHGDQTMPTGNANIAKIETLYYRKLQNTMHQGLILWKVLSTQKQPSCEKVVRPF